MVRVHLSSSLADLDYDVAAGNGVKFSISAEGQPKLPTLVFTKAEVLDVQQWQTGVVEASSLHPIVHALFADLRVNLKDTQDPYVIISDSTSVIILSPIIVPNSTYLDLRYESATLTPGIALRAVCAGFMYNCLDWEYLSRDCQHMKLRTRGALLHPSRIPLEPDETVFATKRRCSDFDRYTLTHSPEHALQFFRWKAHIAANVSRQFVRAQEIIRAETCEFTNLHELLKPRHALLPLPDATRAYLESARRPENPDLHNAVFNSKYFDLELTEELSQPPSRWSGFSRTFRCRLRAVDGKHGDILDRLPDLFVKLFDDRFLEMTLSEQDRKCEDPASWLNNWETAEDAVRIEASVYARLAHVQGSSLPRYYGSHLFRLPNGHEVYGNLLEYIPAMPLSSLSLASDHEQIEFIQSARHALRVLQSADVSQWDWHEDQLLLYVTPTLPRHFACIVIDFETAVQSDPGYDSERCDDYGELEEILCAPQLGLRKKLMEQYWEPREDWDIEYYSNWISYMKT
ncbi:hypothetical protein PLICRDRAFT_179264 [Plicaturopsis crispa FD-325 SS-3]|uniref:Uncharacterized protein n=1 Tax=Plicaturopsis crispa FD-325 SS-3 TaxID=944288 RepID=A0A0C9T9K7_PLICR|nr:hypothetical protein PLICRDRAFT_179264 [Plicaturopsis crispa FD-325 SS-3]